MGGLTFLADFAWNLFDLVRKGTKFWLFMVWRAAVWNLACVSTLGCIFSLVLSGACVIELC